MRTTFIVLLSVVTIFIFIIIVAVMILIERKLLAVSQRRVGPIMLGKRGLLQIVADVIKPLFKEIFEQKIQVVTTTALNIFLLFATQLMLAEFFNFGFATALYDTFDYAILVQFVFAGVSCLAVLFIGILSGSKYAILGAIRLIISEISSDLAAFIIQILIFEACAGISFDVLYTTQTTFTLLQYVGIFYSIIQLFQTFIAAQRSPLDLIEVEGELVAGYNTEFSGADVLIIYFAEYFHLFNGALQFIIFILGSDCINLILFDLLTLFFNVELNY